MNAIPRLQKDFRKIHQVQFIVCLISMTCHPIKGYSMPRGLIITFVVRLYLHFWVIVSWEFFFFLFGTRFYRIRIIYNGSISLIDWTITGNDRTDSTWKSWQWRVSPLYSKPRYQMQFHVISRCPWCNGYRRKKWTRWHEFKT